MNKILQASFAVLLSIFIAGCGIGTPPPEEDFARKIAVQFFQAVHDKKYDEVYSLSDKEFFGPRTQEEWTRYFDKINEVLGPMESYKLKEPHVSTRYSGTFYIFEFRGTYQNGLGKVLITLIHEINSDKPLRVFGYKIESSKLAGM